MVRVARTAMRSSALTSSDCYRQTKISLDPDWISKGPYEAVQAYPDGTEFTTPGRQGGNRPVMDEAVVCNSLEPLDLLALISATRDLNC